MATIKDYLNYYKDTSFDEYAFNELDNILFSELSYINWENIVSNYSSKIRLDHAINIFLGSLNDSTREGLSPFMKSNVENLKIIQNSNRYQNCFLANFRNQVDEEKQFGALCIYFNGGDVYVGFKGTDSTLVGWKEDLALAYTFPTLAQKDAINYLNEVIGWKDNTVYVGGHSKGGNLAMCAYMYSNNKVKKKVKNVFNNDGPGFRDTEYNSFQYKEMLGKLVMFVPEDSIVGVLLNSPPSFKVIKSTFNGPYEHDCNSWECFGSFFVEGRLGTLSKKFKERVDDIVNSYDDKKKEELVDTFFTILQKAGIKSFNNVSSIEWNQVFEIIKGISGIDNTTRDLFLDVFKSFINFQNKDKK